MKLKDWMWIGLAGTGLYIVAKVLGKEGPLAAAKKSLQEAYQETADWVGSAGYLAAVKKKLADIRWQHEIDTSKAAAAAWDTVWHDIRDWRMEPTSSWTHLFSTLIERGWMLPNGSFEGPTTCWVADMVQVHSCDRRAKFLMTTTLESLQQSIYRDNAKGAQWGAASDVFYQLLPA